ncbi:restriction endonuclease subunit S [Arcobacter lacus]|uniref:restriction endonuclease subunit S n=1 Tax=Arcobacter lacus TaxID=1912876 RepID=UPI0021BB55D6|nr:restriction endonuclease subunit S [Arcobacter lacus]MCT7909051.1 restriction endonuclease subunit S [Arcobacter lacus]
MIGTLDTQVIEKFKEFQEKTGRYLDLDIENVEFESIALSDERLFTITMGQSPEGKSLNYNSKGMPFFQGKTDFGKQYLNLPTTWTTKSKKEAKSDDILISLRAPAGAVNIANIDLSIGRGLASIRCQKDIHNVYIYFYLKNNESKINNENNNGGFFSSMNKDYLYNLTIPIPKDFDKKYKSTVIQKAIVEFLEYSFDNLEQIKSNIDKRYEIVSKMKESLIPSTFKKTAIKNTFKKYVKENNINFDITDIEFDINTLKNISQNIRSGATPKKIDTNWTDINDINGIPWLDIDRTEFEKFSIETYRKKITNIGLNSCSTWLVPKGSIMVTIGGSLGFVGINKFDTCTNQNILNIVLKSDYNVPYVMYVLENFYKSNIRNKTSSYGNLSKTSEEVREIFIPKDSENYTSYEIQQILANFIEKMNKEIDEKYFKKYNRLYEVIELLRETYLKRTFSKIVWS